MPRPLNLDHPGYDAECGIDLTAADLARLDATPCSLLIDRDREPQATALDTMSQWGWIGLLCLLVLVGLALIGDNSEVHDPAPGQSAAWMGESLKAQVAQLKGKR